MTITDITFAVRSHHFDENYHPHDATRITTNFANLARGANRLENLRSVLRMIDNRCNALAHWDNPNGDRYRVELDIVSVALEFERQAQAVSFPMLEMLQANLVDRQTGRRIEGVVGNNLSSYVRDYDFSVLLPRHNGTPGTFACPGNFGELHGNLFRHFLDSSAYKSRFRKPPVICLSVSSRQTYRQLANRHPVLGVEYGQDEFSPTDAYFQKMGLQVRYFMPRGSAAPMAFYFTGDLPGDYSNLELIATISTMESFQKIYRPEIYNANSPAGPIYRPNLGHRDYSTTGVVYDREERGRLAVEQGRFAQANFIEPYQAMLEEWSANFAH